MAQHAIGPEHLEERSVLTPVAATGLVLLLVGAAVTHARRGEPALVAVNVVLGLLAALVAWGRFGPWPL